MKKSVKQSINGTNKVGKPVAPKIQKYFKCVPKSFDKDKITAIDNGICNVIDTDNVKAMYVDVLKKKLQLIHDERNGNVNSPGSQQSTEEDDGACASGSTDVHLKSGIDCNNAEKASGCNECEQKMIEAKDWHMKYLEAKVYEQKYKGLKINYAKLAINFSEVDSKYKDLLKIATSSVQSDIDEVASTEKVFTANELTVLRSMPRDEKKDSTFILTCLEYAYKSDLTALQFKTLKGKPEWVEIAEDGAEKYHVGKDALTPKKVQHIKDLFIERVSSGKTDIATYGKRITASNINKLFAAGIKNLAKRKTNV